MYKKRVNFCRILQDFLLEFALFLFRVAPPRGGATPGWRRPGRRQPASYTKTARSNTESCRQGLFSRFFGAAAAAAASGATPWWRQPGAAVKKSAKSSRKSCKNPAVSAAFLGHPGRRQAAKKAQKTAGSPAKSCCFWRPFSRHPGRRHPPKKRKNQQEILQKSCCFGRLFGGAALGCWTELSKTCILGGLML